MLHQEQTLTQSDEVKDLSVQLVLDGNNSQNCTLLEKKPLLKPRHERAETLKSFNRDKPGAATDRERQTHFVKPLSVILLGYKRVTVQLHKNSFIYRIICQASSCGFCLLAKVQIKAFVLPFCSSVAQGEGYSFSSIVSDYLTSQALLQICCFLLGFIFDRGYNNFVHMLKCKADPTGPLNNKELSIFSFYICILFQSSCFYNHVTRRREVKIEYAKQFCLHRTEQTRNYIVCICGNMCMASLFQPC